MHDEIHCNASSVYIRAIVACSILQSIKDGNGKRLSKLLGRRVAGRLRPADLSGSLLEAAAKGNESCVTSLLRAGADANCVDDDGRTPLILLVEKAGATPVIVRELLKAGANPNRVSSASQQGALHAAARRGYQVCVKMVLAAGGRVDVVDSGGHTPLMCAARGGHATIVRALLQDGANVNATNFHGETALHLAARHASCADTAAELVAAGATLDCRDDRQRTPLLLAAQHNHWELARDFLERGCDVNAQDAHSGRCVLHWAVRAVSADTDFIAALLARGAATNSRDKQWQTPLLAALCATGSERRGHVVALLLRCGCDVTATDRDFNTALHITARDGLTSVVPMLVKAGLDVDLKGANGRTPLMLAALGGHARIVDTLLQRGANPNLVARHLATAMHYALIGDVSAASRQDVVKALIRANCQLDHGVQLRPLLASVDGTPLLLQRDGPHIEDRVYMPLEVAFLSQQTVVFVMLLRCGCDVLGFQCDRIRSAEDFMSHQRDAPIRERLLELLNEQRMRVPTLRHLCRRPLLGALGGDARRKIARLAVSCDVKEALSYAELEEIEAVYGGGLAPDDPREVLQRMQTPPLRTLCLDDTPVRVQQPPPPPLTPKSAGRAGWRDSTSSLSPFGRDTCARQTFHFGSSNNLRRSPAEERARRPLGRTTGDDVRSPPPPGRVGGGRMTDTDVSATGAAPAAGPTHGSLRRKARSRILNMADLTMCNGPAPIPENSELLSSRSRAPSSGEYTNGAGHSANDSGGIGAVEVRRRTYSQSEVSGGSRRGEQTVFERLSDPCGTPRRHHRPTHPNVALSRPATPAIVTNIAPGYHTADRRAYPHAEVNGGAHHTARPPIGSKRPEFDHTAAGMNLRAGNVDAGGCKPAVRPHSSGLNGMRCYADEANVRTVNSAQQRTDDQRANALPSNGRVTSPGYGRPSKEQAFCKVAPVINFDNVDDDDDTDTRSSKSNLKHNSMNARTVINGTNGTNNGHFAPAFVTSATETKHSISSKSPTTPAPNVGTNASPPAPSGGLYGNGSPSAATPATQHTPEPALPEPASPEQFFRYGSMRSRIPVPRTRSAQTPSPSLSPQSPMSPMSPASPYITRANGYANPIHVEHGRHAGFNRTRSFRY